MGNLPQTPAGPRRHPGRLYLALAVLLALAGPAAYAAQLHYRVLAAPWYVPALATVGVVLAGMALARSRSVWRWGAAVLLTLLAAAEWAMMLGPLSAPAYTGPVKAGQEFPEFTTTLADGSSFTREDLKKDKNTVMVFFRGRW